MYSTVTNYLGCLLLFWGVVLFFAGWLVISGLIYLAHHIHIYWK